MATRLECREIWNLILQILDQVLIVVRKRGLPPLGRIETRKSYFNFRIPIASLTDLSAEAFTTPVMIADVELDGFAVSRALRT